MRAVSCVVLALSGVALASGQTPRPEFEVASVRPTDQSNPAEVTAGVRVDGAQVNTTYLSLKDYIRVAYRVKDFQISGPEWLASQRFDIAAKIPAGGDREKVPEMLQALLEDRFKLKVRMESKEFPVYAMVPGKGGVKLKEAVTEDGKPIAAVEGDRVMVTAKGGASGVNISLGPRSYFAFADNKLEVRGMGMTMFCDTLSRFTDKPVVDMTGLTGAYDVTLNFTPEDYMAMLIRSAINAGVTLPPQALKLLEASAGDSLGMALQTVGLKLDSRKSPLPLLVVERIEKAPTAN